MVVPIWSECVRVAVYSPCTLKLRLLREASPNSNPDPATRTPASIRRLIVSDTLDALLQHPIVTALIEQLGGVIAGHLRVPSEPPYYTTKENPLGSGRAFRDAARRGEFPSFRLSRLVAARRADVHAWLESRPRRISQSDLHASRTSKANAVEDKLAEFGLRALPRPSSRVARCSAVGSMNQNGNKESK